MYGCSAGPLRRSKRLNVIQVTNQCDDEDGDCNNGEQCAPGHESQALDNEEGQVHNQGNNLLHFVLLLINLYMLSIERINGGCHLVTTFLNSSCSRQGSTQAQENKLANCLEHAKGAKNSCKMQ